MTPPLTISEQERLQASNMVLLAAIDRVVRCQKDYDMFPTSTNYRRSLREAINKLKSLAEKEKQFINNEQKQLF